MKKVINYDVKYPGIEKYVNRKGGVDKTIYIRDLPGLKWQFPV